MHLLTSLATDILYENPGRKLLWTYINQDNHTRFAIWQQTLKMDFPRT